MAEENFDGQEISDMPENSYEISGMPEDSHPSGMPEDSHPSGMPENSHPSGMPENSHPSDIPDNSHPPEIQGSENDSKDDGGAIDEEKRWPGWPGENVFRMLVPVQKVGSIIGRKGEYIKKTCEETRARIKILDGPPGSTERTVLISAKEEPVAQIPPAMDGLLKVHTRIVDVDTDPAHAPPGAGGIVCTRMLVAATQAGSLIGKQGATIKSIQDGSNCVIRVLGGEHLPVFALPDDSIVEVQGEPVGVHKAIELIATHLRKFLVDRSVVGIFETQMQMAIDRGNHDMPPPQSWGPPPPQSWGPPPPQSWGPPPQGFPMNDGPGYVPDQQYIPPQRQFDNYYPPPADMPPMDKQPPREGPPASYGRDAPMGTQTPMQQPQQSMVTKVTQNMQIPLAYADAVIGTSGANISYMRRASGASIVIQETMGNPSEMTVEIIGSASQVQTAQQLIQNFIAEAASAAAQNAQAAPPPGHGQEYNPYPANHGLGQEYNPYPANHGPGPAAYQSEPPNATGHLPAGDYGSVYGNNYGY